MSKIAALLLIGCLSQSCIAKNDYRHQDAGKVVRRHVNGKFPAPDDRQRIAVTADGVLETMPAQDSRPRSALEMSLGEVGNGYVLHSRGDGNGSFATVLKELTGQATPAKTGAVDLDAPTPTEASAFDVVASNRKCSGKNLQRWSGHVGGKTLQQCYTECKLNPSCRYFAHWPADANKHSGGKDDCRIYPEPCEPYKSLARGYYSYYNTLYKITQAAPCTVDDGSDVSSAYPCACGTATCTNSWELCSSRANLCQAATPTEAPTEEPTEEPTEAPTEEQKEEPTEEKPKEVKVEVEVKVEAPTTAAPTTVPDTTTEIIKSCAPAFNIDRVLMSVLVLGGLVPLT